MTKFLLFIGIIGLCLAIPLLAQDESPDSVPPPNEDVDPNADLIRYDDTTGYVEPLYIAAQTIVSKNPSKNQLADALDSIKKGGPIEFDDDEEANERYRWALKKYQEKGRPWVDKEIDRLTRLAMSKNVARAQRREFAARRNVLRGFSIKKAGKPAHLSMMDKLKTSLKDIGEVRDEQ